MRVISWNCNMAFRRKIQMLEELNPDIMVVPECEAPEKLSAATQEKYDIIWAGDNRNKGLGIFADKSKIRLTANSIETENNRWFVPVTTSNGTRFIAVWAMNHRKNSILNGIPASYQTIRSNPHLFNTADFVIGDFNDNPVFHKTNSKIPKPNFHSLVALLKEHGLQSVYHTKSGSDNYGAESTPTFIFRKNLTTSYHIDYCFVRNELFPLITKFEILAETKWLLASDHYPLLVEYTI